MSNSTPMKESEMLARGEYAPQVRAYDFMIRFEDRGSQIVTIKSLSLDEALNRAKLLWVDYESITTLGSKGDAEKPLIF